MGLGPDKIVEASSLNEWKDCWAAKEKLDDDSDRETAFQFTAPGVKSLPVLNIKIEEQIS